MSPRIYETSVKYWPQSERPRERLLQQGAESLSDGELLAIFLRTGIKGVSAVDLGRQLLHQFGGLRGLLRATAERLQEVKGLGPAKISALLAINELGKRYLAEEIRQEKAIECPEDVFDLLRYELRDEKREIFAVLLLNSKHRVIHFEKIFWGTVDTSEVHPREVVRMALDRGAPAMICAHNHPSGDPKPSREDEQSTRALQDAARLMNIALLDHLIIAGNLYYSFANAGKMPA